MCGKKWIPIVAMLALFFPSLNSFQYELGICAIFKEEISYMPEWIEFHERQGVEKFWLYYNGEGNECEVILKKYIESGLIELTHWPYKYNKIQEWSAVQIGAYEDCLKKIKNLCKWCAFLDSDEFLFSPQGICLPEALREFDRYPGVVVNWIMYGTSNLQKNVPGQSMLEALVFRAPLDFWGNLSVKSIVKAHLVQKFNNPHCCTYLHGYAVTENHTPMEHVQTSFVSVNKLRINHYWTRDEDYFYKVKLPRRLVFGDDEKRCLEVKEDLNAEFDDYILRYSFRGC